MKKENQIVIFQADEQEFPMEIIDHKGEKWITRKQLAISLGSDIEPLHRRMLERCEIKEGIHFTVISTEKSQRGNPNIIIYSYRGIIRIGMASEGQRAIAFRDWAEDILYEAMIRSYQVGFNIQKEPVKNLSLEAYQIAVGTSLRQSLLAISEQHKNKREALEINKMEEHQKELKDYSE